MTEIPEEVMREAQALTNWWFRGGHRELAIDIAKALLARDKRAAEIARRRPPGVSGKRIATAILTYRQSNKEPKP